MHWPWPWQKSLGTQLQVELAVQAAGISAQKGAGDVHGIGTRHPPGQVSACEAQAAPVMIGMHVVPQLGNTQT
jgi:hypothetical protein